MGFVEKTPITRKILMHETQHSVHLWTTQTFPKNSTPKKRLQAFIEEVYELAYLEGFSQEDLTDLLNNCYTKCKIQAEANTQEVYGAEAADAYSCLLSYASTRGFNLQEELDTKMAFCRSRPLSYYKEKEKTKRNL
jgi:hypothetical protein